jgi:glycolate oxidase subunit GlcD
MDSAEMDTGATDAARESAIRRLARMLRGVAVHTERHYRVAYSYDATTLRGRCGGVAFPANADQLLRIVKGARDLGVPIYVRGAGSGFSGGSIPLDGGLVVSTERLHRVLAWNPGGGEVTVESGIINKELQDYLEPYGYFYPPDPASFRFSTIGGNIAENAGGPRAYKYGVTRRYVRSLTWITAEGDLLETPPDGPAALLIGGEGTLGVIYAARLAVLALPGAYRTALVAAPSDAEAISAAAALLASGVCPSVIEFIDAKTMRCVGEYRRVSGVRGGMGYLFVEIDGSPDEVSSQFTLLGGFCAKRNLDLLAARDERERETLWELRRSISPSLARRGITKVNEDISLPLGRMEETVAFIQSSTRELSLDCYVFGHCGDGNLHVNIMTDRRRSEEMRRIEEFVERLFERVAALGGTLSGEHGIGLTKAPYLGMIFSPEELRLQRDLKRAMDPAGVLNPGKYFSAGRT